MDGGGGRVRKFSTTPNRYESKSTKFLLLEISEGRWKVQVGRAMPDFRQSKSTVKSFQHIEWNSVARWWVRVSVFTCWNIPTGMQKLLESFLPPSNSGLNLCRTYPPATSCPIPELNAASPDFRALWLFREATHASTKLSPREDAA